MKTETYNGIDIFFNSTSRLYFTKDFIYSRANNRTKGTVMSTRVERVKEEIDIFVKRCVAIKNKTFVFIRKRYDKGYEMYLFPFQTFLVESTYFNFKFL